MVKRGSYLWHKITKSRHVEPPYWRIAHMDRKKIREIYYELYYDPARRGIWRMLMDAYYHKVSEKEIMDFLIYHRGYCEDYAHDLMIETKKMWLLSGWIKVKK